MTLQPFTQVEGNALVTNWSVTSAAPTGNAAFLPGLPDRAVQVFGNFGGASILLEGSNDNSNWAQLHDPTGADLIFTAAGIAAVLENPLYIRPNVSGGAGVDVTVIMANRRSV